MTILCSYASQCPVRPPLALHLYILHEVYFSFQIAERVRSSKQSDSVKPHVSSSGAFMTYEHPRLIPGALDTAILYWVMLHSFAISLYKKYETGRMRTCICVPVTCTAHMRQALLLLTDSLLARVEYCRETLYSRLSSELKSF